MNARAAFGVVLGGLVLASAASAQISTINSVAIGTRYFNDFPNSTLVVTNNGLPSVEFQESNFGTGGFANRHIGMLSNNGTTPYHFSPAGNVDFSVTVLMHAAGAVEAGMFIGKIPNFPTGAGADTGQFPLLPNNGEIAAFGGFLPFFSNNVPPNTGLPRAARDTSFTLRFMYDSAANTVTYGVNGQFTPALALDPNNPFPANCAVGVYVQNVNGQPTQGLSSDVLFTNFTITPAPGSALVLGAFGLLAGRRRRA
jgi:hypothetical protein